MSDLDHKLAEHSNAVLESVADIAYFAGHTGFTTGDSRLDVSFFIHWAKEFEFLHSNTNWDVVDYILLIENFATQKIKEEKSIS